ncbi:hypothetical protein [Vibrio diazotrophicus]|uniref:hypothetical protein n=1 Tax=Vibrio diazotrophicus TaxID=685 RepID=UPI000C9DFCB9|nr:hypothetical protein [Vibrio diazotrophicus]PNH81342.1 hypothetical protein C1N27_07300 [Vibrio diazotrophicus]
MSLFRRTGLNYTKLDGVVISLDRMEQEKLSQLLGDTPIEEMNPLLKEIFEIWLQENQIKTYKIKAKQDALKLLVSLKEQQHKYYN